MLISRTITAAIFSEQGGLRTPRLFLLAVLSAFLVFVSGVLVRAAQSDGDVYRLNAAQCAGWENAAQAREITLLKSSDTAAFTRKNSASLVHYALATRYAEGEEDPLGLASPDVQLNCSGFTPPDGFPDAGTVHAAEFVVSLGVETQESSEDVLAFSYSADGGETWIPLGSIALLEDTSNLTQEGYRHFPITPPDGFFDSENLDELRFRAEYFADESAQTATLLFLDGVELQLQASTPPETFELPEGAAQLVRRDFQANEQPVFALETEKRPPLSFLGLPSTQREIRSLTVTDPYGEEFTDLYSTEDVKQGRRTITQYRIAPDVFTRPGRYSLTVEVVEDGAVAVFTQDFTWGVLAMNTPKPLYRPGEKVDAGIAVLDNLGNTVCDASLTLAVIAPSGAATMLSTDDGSIRRSEECGPETVTNLPDYAGTFTVEEAGAYALELTATTDAGTFTITDSIAVQELIAFDTTRLAPTRIYPEAAYTMYLEVLPQEPFVGTVVETLPAEFAVPDIGQGGTRIAVDETRQEIRWEVSWEAGQPQTLSYTFDAPNVSPEFYLLGPVAFGATYTEPRQWQIASDATDNLIGFFDGTTIPTGWTCISCTIGDDFYQRFPRGASTYGGTGGASTHTHSISWASSDSVSGNSGQSTGGATVAGKHTHNTLVSSNMDAATSLPQYQNIKVIRYDTTGDPATLPAGFIGMFDTSVPTGWTRYSAQDGDFIYGENDATGTGGALTHTHSNVTITTGGPSTTTGNTGTDLTGASTSHTHSASPAGITASADHAPPYRDVVLGKADSNTSIPDGLIALWDATPTGGSWNVISDTGGAFDGRFLVGASTYGGTGGASTHTHSNLNITTGGPSATGTTAIGTGKGFGSATHTHTIGVSFGSANNLPPYIDVIVAKYSQMDYSGRIYTDEGTTGLDCTTSRTVNLRINGTGTQTVECSNSPSNGSFSFTGLSVNSGDIITLYLDNETEQATTVFVADGTSQTDIALYQNTLIVRADTGSVTNANLATGDDGDPDVLYSVATNTLTVDSGIELHVWAGDTFAPGGTITTQGSGGDVHIGASATLNAGGSAVTITGAFDNDGTYTPGANATTFTASSGTVTIDSTSAFNNVEFNGAATFTHSSALDVNGTLTLTAGTFQQGANVNVNVAGNFTIANGATFTKASGTGMLIFDGDLTFTDNNTTKNDLGNVQIGTSPDTTDLASDFVATGLTVNALDVFNTNGYDLYIGTRGITISGTLDATDDVETDETFIETQGDFTLNSGGTFTEDQSTVTFTGTSGISTITDNATLTFYNLVLNDGGGSLQVDAASSFEVSNDLTITGGTLNIQSGVTLTHNGTTLTLSDIISGAGRLTYTSATNFPTTGTISSILRFDMTNTAQNIPARTYGGDVEVYANTATARIATALAGTITVNGSLSTSTDNAAVTLELNTNNPTLDIAGTVTIGAGTTLSGTTGTFTVGGSWSNSGTYTHNNGTVTFDATDTGNTISGTLNGTSPFYKVSFNGSGGAWTVQNAMLVDAANATDTYVVHAGTVTHGDGNGDDLEVRGKMVIAGTAGETATFQTAALAEGSTLTFDMNENTATPTCANCIIQVGATSGAGAGTLKIQKNTVLRLNPRAAATASDTGVEVESTGYAQIIGSQDDTGTSDGTTDDTTLTDTSKTWTTNEHANKKIRITNTDSPAFGLLYTISSNTATALTINDTSSADATISSIGDTSSVYTRKICSNSSALIAANDEEMGRYLHDKTGTTGYLKIVDSTNDDSGCSSNDSFEVVASPDAFSILATSDTFDISDGVQQNDTFEILDYASVTGENGTSCGATIDEAGEGYIQAKAGSQLLIQYAEICDLGRYTAGKTGIGAMSGMNGSNANEGVRVDTSEIHNLAAAVQFSSASNMNSSNTLDGVVTLGITDNNIYSIPYNATLFSSADNNLISQNRVYDIGTTTSHYALFNSSGSDNNTYTSNYVYRAVSAGILLYGNGATISSNFFWDNWYGIFLIHDNATISSNHSFGNNNYGIYNSTGSDNNTYSSNEVYHNDSMGIRDNASSNSVYDSNSIYDNASYGLFTSNSVQNITISSNTLYRNSTFQLYLSRTTGSIIRNNTIYSDDAKSDYGYYFYGTSPSVSNNTFIGNNIYDNRWCMGFDGTAADVDNVFIGDNCGGNGDNRGGDLRVISTQPHEAHFYNVTLASTETANTISPAGMYIISRKHDGTAGATKIWGEYSIPANDAETPQTESTTKFNYADNLWEDSFTPHAYHVGYGAGTEDTDLGFAINGTFGGNEDAYAYRVVCTASNCVTTANSWDVYRNGTLLTAKASTGTQYTDTQVDGTTAPNVQFTIEDAGTDYTAGAQYTFVAYKASGDANTQKSITMMQDADTFTVGSGTTLELKGDTSAYNPTTVTRDASGGYQFIINGTIDADRYTFDYLGGTGQSDGIDINSGATVTNLSHGEFDNYATNVGTGDSYINVDSSVIGTGTPSLTIENTHFADTTGSADCNVNATGTDATGYWEFTGSFGSFGGEANDGNECPTGDANPGQIRWTGPTLTFSISNTTTEFGTLSPSAARWADNAGGSSTDVVSHTLSVTTNADSGYTVTYNGATLTSGTDTITAFTDGIVDDANGTPGTEQFGLSIATDGDATIASGYAYAGIPDWKFVPDTTTTIITEASSTATETFSIHYLANISDDTEPGTYSTNITYIATGNF